MIISKAWMAWGIAAAVGGCASIVGCNDDGSSTGATSDPIAGEACDEVNETAACEEDGGVATCLPAPDVGQVWSECLVSECMKGQTQSCSNHYSTGTSMTGFDAPGQRSCEVDDEGNWHWGPCTDSSSATPLVLSFDGAAPSFTQAAGSFDLDPMMSVGTDWVDAATPWLAMDRNHDGRIENGGELFGSATALSMGGFAKNGFVALAELDENHDGMISSADSSFSSLVVWADRNQDRVSQPEELTSLASLGITSIDLSFGSHRSCDDRGNCGVETSSFGFVDATGRARKGQVTDVYLRHHD